MSGDRDDGASGAVGARRGTRAGGRSGQGPHGAAHILGSVPVVPRTYVTPGRLWAVLDDAAAAATVTLVVAPAGAGKTLGVAGWVRRRAARGAVPERVRWLVASAATTPADLRAAVEGVRGRGTTPGAPGVVVVDDAEHLSAACLAVVDDLLDRRPPGVRLVLLSRWEVELSLVAAQLLGSLVVLRGDVLRVADDDARTLVRRHAPGCPDAVVERIVEQAEGWCATLVLAARAVRARGLGPDDVVPAAFGPGISDLVAREVFAGLDPRERHLLLAVVHEPVVTAETAAHLANDPGAGEILERLESAGLLVGREPLGHGGEAFRLHAVLADVVRRHFGAGGVDVARARGTIARAGRVDVVTGDLVDGLRRVVLGGGAEAAATVLDVHGLPMVLRGDGAEVRAAATACGAVLAEHPGAHLALGLERSVAGDGPAAARHLAAVVAAGPAATGAADAALAHLLLARLGLEPLGAACEAGLAALASPEPVGQGRRTLLQALVGEAQVWLGDLAAGEEHLGAAAHGARAEGSVQLASEVLAGLALAEYSRGRMADAARLARTAEATRGSDGRTPACVRALAALHADPWHPPDDGAWADPGPHLLARFWGDLAAATVPALRGRTRLALAALGAPVELPELPAPLAAARETVRALVAAAADDLAELRGARSRLAEHAAAAGVRFVDGVLAVLRRDLRTALEAFRAAGDDPDAAPQPDVATLALVCAAQVAEGLGDETGAARLLGAATERAELRRDALAFVGWLGHVPPVHAVLARVRPPAGSWAAGVLATARDAGSLHALVARTTPTANEARRAGRPVAPPLTQREREVLERLARGASYADIAADLVLSANTVKTHVASLYAKLGAGRRSDALATARTYDLL